MDLKKISENGRAVLIAPADPTLKREERKCDFEIFIYVEKIKKWLGAENLATYLLAQETNDFKIDEFNGNRYLELGTLSKPPFVDDDKEKDNSKSSKFNNGSCYLQEMNTPLSRGRKRPYEIQISVKGQFATDAQGVTTWLTYHEPNDLQTTRDGILYLDLGVLSNPPVAA